MNQEQQTYLAIYLTTREIVQCNYVNNNGERCESMQINYGLCDLHCVVKKYRICRYYDCKTSATYGYNNSKTGLFCSKHKLDKMIDIVSKKCIKCNIKRSNFNYENEQIALYCGSCKLDGMIDIVSKKCIKCNIKISNFNYENEIKALYCADCKLNGMIDIKHKKCIKCNIKRSNFNYENEIKALYCKDCKLNGMIDINHKRCKTYGCYVRVDGKDRDYCLKCSSHIGIDNKYVGRYKTKENRIAEFITKTYPNLTITYDKVVEGGCSKGRPDIYMNLGEYVIIIGVDEH